MFDPSMLGRLSEMKQLAEESKMKLDALSVQGEAGNGLIVITLSGNREFRSIEINTQLSHMTKEDLEDLLSVAFTRALEAAEKLNQSETMSAASALFNGMK